MPIPKLIVSPQYDKLELKNGKIMCPLKMETAAKSIILEIIFETTSRYGIIKKIENRFRMVNV